MWITIYVSSFDYPQAICGSPLDWKHSQSTSRWGKKCLWQCVLFVFNILGACIDLRTHTYCVCVCTSASYYYHKPPVDFVNCVCVFAMCCILLFLWVRFHLYIKEPGIRSIVNDFECNGHNCQGKLCTLCAFFVSVCVRCSLEFIHIN